jgi:hypothetical protein
MTPEIQNKKHRKKFSTAENIAPPNNKTATGGRKSANNLVNSPINALTNLLI